MDYWNKLSLILVLCAVHKTQAHGHEGHVTMDVDKPIKELFSSAMAMNATSKTMVEMIEEYVNGTTVEDLKNKLNISQQVVDALNTTSFKIVASCFDNVSMDSSITDVLKMAMNKFVLTAHFKMEKLGMLNETGLLELMANDTSNNTLEFCSNLMMSAKRNYRTILDKEAMRRISNNNSTVYEGAFKMLGVSNEHLMDFLIAKYTKDEKNIKRLSLLIHDSILSMLGQQKNLSAKEKLKTLVETTFSLPINFFGNELQQILGFKSFLTRAFDKSQINSLPGYINETTSVKDLILAALPADSTLEKLFSLPIAVAVRHVGIKWKSFDDIKKLNLHILASMSIGIKKESSISDFISIEWLAEKANIQLPATVLVSKARFELLNDFDKIPALHFLSIHLIDFLSLYNHKSPLPIPSLIPGKLLELGKESYEKNMPTIFNTIPVSMIKAKFLEEDFNVKKFYNLLQTFFGEQDLQAKIMLKQVTYYYVTSFTGKFLHSEFNASTLGELREKIVTDKAQAFVFLVINGNLQQTNQLCAQKGRNLTLMKIKDMFKECIDKDFNQELIQSTINKASMTMNMTKPWGIIKTGDMTLFQIFAILGSRNVNLAPGSHSIRELLILSAAEDGFLMANPIIGIVNASDPSRVANLTVQEIMGEARIQNGFPNDSMNTGLLEAWANKKEISMFTNVTVKNLLPTLTPEQLIQLGVGDIINLVSFPYKRPFLLMCVNNTMLNQTLEALTQCLTTSKITLDLLGYSKVKPFTATEIGFITNGMVKPTMNIFQVIDLTNRGYDTVIKHTAEPLILLARGNNISLSALKTQTMETTLVQIFKVDTNIIRKVFSDIDDRTYGLVSMTPLKDLVNEDSGIKSVQEFYTGSVQTMAATVLAGITSVEAIEKHLPRYVTLISGKTFPELFYIYETSPVEIKDMSVVEIVHMFFGNFTDNTFKAVYSVNDEQFSKLQRLTYQNVVSSAQLIHGAEKTSTLLKLIQFGATVEEHKVGFLTASIKDLFTKGENITIRSLEGFNVSFGAVFKKLVRNSYRMELKDSIVNYFLQSDLKTLRVLIKKNMTDIENLMITDLFKMTLEHINECSFNNGYCPTHGLCQKKMQGFLCECKDGYSGNGTKCEDKCGTEKFTCGKYGICINDVNGPVCRCSNKFIFKEGKCKSSKRIVKVKGMKFKEDYDPDYANRTSKKFLRLAERVEPILLKALKNRSSNVEAVVITGVTEGSIVVDAEVFVEDDTTSTESVSNILEEAAKNNELGGLTPAANFSASVNELDPCKPNPCGDHMTCVKQDAATHSCKCVDGYEMKDGMCKKDDDDDLALKVALPVCLIGGLLLVILIFCCCCRNKNSKYKATEHEMGAAENKAYEK